MLCDDIENLGLYTTTILDFLFSSAKVISVFVFLFELGAIVVVVLLTRMMMMMMMMLVMLAPFFLCVTFCSQLWWVRAGRELFWRFRTSTNDYDDHDRTRMPRIKRIIRMTFQKKRHRPS